MIEKRDLKWGEKRFGAGGESFESRAGGFWNCWEQVLKDGSRVSRFGLMNRLLNARVGVIEERRRDRRSA